MHLKATEVAKGISEALLLTFEGVGLAVPAICFFSFFRNRVSLISVTTMTRADEFLRHFAQAARTQAGRPPPPPAPRHEENRYVRLRSSDVTRPTPNLTPILDMVFQLITFFMLVINFKAAELDQTLTLPVVGSRRARRKATGSYLVLNVKQDDKHPEGFLAVYGNPYYKDAIDNFIKDRGEGHRAAAKLTLEDVHEGRGRKYRPRSSSAPIRRRRSTASTA